MSISTHVLDTSAGRPASGIVVRLQHLDHDTWIDLAQQITDADGRVPGLLPRDRPAAAGTFRLTFDVAGYFAARGQDTFYTSVAIDFVVRDPAQHYHVPLLLSPYGYTTYRGS